MRDVQRHLDTGSRVIILITVILFVAALFLKGFGHDLLLEAGVFLVSVKLIMMAYKNSVAAGNLSERLAGLEAALTRIENLLEPTRPSETAAAPPDAARRPPTAIRRSGEAREDQRGRG